MTITVDGVNINMHNANLLNFSQSVVIGDASDEWLADILYSDGTSQSITRGEHGRVSLPIDKDIFITSWWVACLLACTKISLADGTTKNIEDITYDDELLVWDFDNGCFSKAKSL